MRVLVKHEKPAAHHLFYPADNWTESFLQVLSSTRKQKSFSLKQLRKLKELGFEVEVIEEPVKVKEVKI